MLTRDTSAVRSLLLLTLALAGCDQIATQLGVGPAFVVVEDAHGVQIGNQVRVHGVTVGRVTEIGLVPEGARIAFELANREVLHADACGEVRREGLDGEAYVHLDTGSSEEPWAGTFTPCATPTLDDTIAQTAGLLGDLRRYVGALESGDRTLCTVTAPTSAPVADAPTTPEPTPTPEVAPEPPASPTPPAEATPVGEATPPTTPATE